MLPSELTRSGVDIWTQLSNTTKFINSDSNITSSQIIKAKQLAQLKLLPYRVVELKKDSEYKVVISEIPEFSVFVTIPQSYPHEKPHIRVSVPITHPWIINSVLIDECPLLNDIGGKSISQIVMEVVDELAPVHAKKPMSLQRDYLTSSGVQTLSGNLQQPTSKPTSSKDLPMLPIHPTFQPANGVLMSTAPVGVKSSANLTLGHRCCDPCNAIASSTFCVLPTTNSSFAQSSLVSTISSACNIEKARIASVQDLDKLSTEEITLTLNDPERLEELVMSCHGDQVEMFRTRRKEFASQLEELACSNLAKVITLEEKKAHLIKKLAEHQELADKLDTSVKLLNEKYKSIPDADIMFDSMRVITMEAEEKSDALAKSFTEGNVSIEEFLKAFQEQRKLFHVRSVKCHKFNEHLFYGLPL